MSRLGKSIIPSSRLSPFLPCRSNGRQFRPTRAKKPGIGENSQAKTPTFSLRISKAFLARSAVAVFALGFLDAGYSGDWSRIGVITKETEELLKLVQDPAFRRTAAVKDLNQYSYPYWKRWMKEAEHYYVQRVVKQRWESKEGKK